MTITNEERDQIANAKAAIRRGDYVSAHRILRTSTHPLASNYKRQVETYLTERRYHEPEKVKRGRPKAGRIELVTWVPRWLLKLVVVETLIVSTAIPMILVAWVAPELIPYTLCLAPISLMVLLFRYITWRFYWHLLALWLAFLICSFSLALYTVAIGAGPLANLAAQYAPRTYP